MSPPARRCTAPSFRPLLLGLAAVILGASLPATARAAEATSAATPPLTLDECVQQALRKNFGLQIQQFSTANAQQSLVIAKSGYDPGFFASLGKSVNQADQTATSLVGSRNEQNTTRVGVNQKLTSGATVSLSSDLNRTATNNSYAILNPAYNSDLTLSITQPLLQNAGATVNRAAIEQARIGLDVAHLNYQSQVLQVIANTETAYYNLVYARSQLHVLQLSLDLAQQLYSENQTRKNTGVATDLDVLQAAVGVATARNKVLQAQKTAQDAQDQLLNLLGPAAFNATLGPVTLPAVAAVHPDFARAYQLARDHQPDYLSAQRTLKQLAISAAAAKRNRLPELDLGGAVGYNATDRSASSAINRVPEGDGYSWQLNLTLNLPWGMRAEKAQYLTALNNYHRQQTLLGQIEQNLTVQVRSAVRAVETNLSGVDISRQATQLSEKQYGLEKARFDAGLSTSREVLQAQDDLENARISELQARVSLLTAESSLRQLEGSSLEKYHIVLADDTAR